MVGGGGAGVVVIVGGGVGHGHGGGVVHPQSGFSWLARVATCCVV
jgi:hypothetical protein